MKLIDDKTGKSVTFFTNMDVNYFLGANDPQISYLPVCEETYLKLCHYGAPRQWDDGSEMESEEWVRCVKTIYG